MSLSRYEKYIIRKAVRPEPDSDESTWTSVPGSMSVPPYLFLHGDNPVKGAIQFFETTWIWSDTIIGNTKEKPPHIHDYEEIFFINGTNEKDPDNLGAEVDFWMGQENESDKISFNSSSLIFVPKNLPHLPIVFKKVKKPILLVTIGTEVGDKMPVQIPVKEL